MKDMCPPRLILYPSALEARKYTHSGELCLVKTAKGVEVWRNIGLAVFGNGFGMGTHSRYEFKNLGAANRADIQEAHHW